MITGDASAKAVCKFIIPEININAVFYQNIVDFDKIDVRELHETKIMNNRAMRNFKTSMLALDVPCHNQAVECHVKFVTEAFVHVAGFEKWDGTI